MWTLAELNDYCERNAIYVEIDGDRKCAYGYNLDGSAAGIIFNIF